MSVSHQPALDTTASIETPEHVHFSVRLAGPSRRAFAYLIDLLIRGAIVLGFAFIAAIAGADVDFEGTSTGITLVVMFALEWGYYILLESMMSGRTPGKKAMGLRTVKEGGYPVTFIDVVLRNLLRGADWLPAFNIVGLVVMGFDRRFRRLGDLVAGTMVVAEENSRIGSALQVSPAPTTDEMEFIPASARLSGEERDAIELFLRRAPALAPARAAELAELLTPIFSARYGLKITDPTRFLAVLWVRAGGGVAAPPLPERKRRWGRA